jgi:hypothetical protein
MLFFWTVDIAIDDQGERNGFPPGLLDAFPRKSKGIIDE